MKLPNLDAMYRDMAEAMSNQVKCRHCGTTQAVDPAHCLRHGWPKCCGATMELTTKKAG
jgi:hypothetical protein